MSLQNQNTEKIIKRLDAILESLKDLFILEAVKVNMPKEEIRKILKIDKKRVNRISKHIEP